MKQMYKFLLLLSFVSLFFSSGKAQQTVGLFINEPTSFEGYTLFAPVSSQRTLLIDNCGRLVHSWESELFPGLSAYLLENGNLLRTGRAPSGKFGGGGQGGIVELFDWDGEPLWQYQYANDTVMQHHDIEHLPNGNVLILAWEAKTKAQTIAVGRDSTFINNSFWFEHIVEVKPIFPDSGEIVWRWSIMDHLVQNVDSLLDNFGIPSEHPEKLDINYFPSGFAQGFSGPDWVHANAIDYNPELDQIVLGSRHLGELWIIDHSTTTAEAASDRGGRYGKGGDLLYRWGNPATYGRGTDGDKQLFGPHDVNWIPTGYPGGGQIMIFNNGIGQPGRDLTSVITIEPPVLPSGNYQIPLDTLPYGPSSPAWKYDGVPNNEFFARNLSGAQRLPNGNTLICNGPKGDYFEVDTMDNIVWSYLNPLSRNEPIAQGAPPGINSTFRTYRYALDFPAFDNKTLSPGDPLELNPLPLPASCVMTSIDPEQPENDIQIFPNPFREEIHIHFSQIQDYQVQVLDVYGRLIFQHKTYGNVLEIPTDQWPPGIYFVRTGKSRPYKVIKVQ